MRLFHRVVIGACLVVPAVGNARDGAELDEQGISTAIIGGQQASQNQLPLLCSANFTQNGRPTPRIFVAVLSLMIVSY